MSYAIDKALVAALAGLVQGRVYPMRLPDAPAFPSIVYSLAGSTPENTMCGPSTLTNYRYRFSVFSAEHKEVSQIIASIKSAMTNFAFQNLPQSEFEMYEAETQVYHRILDYSVWDDSNTGLASSAAR